jgi:hypothetical protein
MMVYATREFAKFAAKNGISDEALCDSVARAENGLVDAKLAGPLIKQRVARTGQGKARGYRVILVYEKSGVGVFVYGFPKSARANLSKPELEAFAEFGKAVIALSPPALSALEVDRKWRRLDCEQFEEKVPE